MKIREKKIWLSERIFCFAIVVLVTLLSRAGAGEPLLLVDNGKPMAANENGQAAFKVHSRAKLVVVRTDSSPAVDGVKDAAIWSKANAVDIHFVSGGAPAVPTGVRALYDATNIYFLIDAREPLIEKLQDQTYGRDGNIFGNECAEIFLDPNALGQLSYQFVMAPQKGAWYDAKVFNAGASRDTKWNPAVQWAYQRDLKGKAWRMEIAVPFAELGVGTPKEGEFWLANFTRTTRVAAFGLPEDAMRERFVRKYNSWSPIFGEQVNYADPKGMGILWFGKEAQCGMTALSNVMLPFVIDRSMVLQRDCPCPIWGKASPGETVRVRFRDQDKTVRADDQGRWQVKLDPLKAGGPDTMRVTDANGVDLVLDDVLVGEVWVGAGQSNMALDSHDLRKGDKELDRLIQAASYPRLRILQDWRKWQRASSNTIDTFSALMFAFGQRLQAELDVPVGLLVRAECGSPSGSWIVEKDYRADAACKAVAAKFATTYDLAAARKSHAALMARWNQEAADAKAAGKYPPQPPPEPQPAGEYYGKPYGTIGHLFEKCIRPFIPFAIRGVLWDQGEADTAMTGVDQYTLMGSLIHGWRQEWGQGDFPFLYVQKPSGGGCAWDPADVSTREADAFSPLPRTMPNNTAGGSRAMYIRIMGYPNTYMVAASDLGGGTHPTNKSGYGARAARVALGAVYGKPLEIYGPIFQKHTIEGEKVRLAFTHTGRGLAFKHGAKLQGFAVAGADRVFHWADALIDGNTVVVSAAQVPQPAAVRYAWGSAHPWANLFNRDGLPALTFRTDNW